MATLDTVQGLRAIAAWQVIVAHGALWAGQFGSLGLPVRSYELLGAFGVLMFFTISGFIMVFISRREFGDAGAAGAFFLRRVVRIVPLYWLMTALLVAIIVRRGDTLPVADVVQSLLFIPYPGGEAQMRPILGVGWTLNYEMFFYVIFAVALMFKWGLKALFVMIGVLLVIGQYINPIWNYRDPSSPFGAWTDILLIPFLFGMGFAVLRQSMPKLRVTHALFWVAAALCALLLVQAEFVGEGSYPWWWRLTVPIVGAGVAGLAILAQEGGPSGRVPQWLVFCGNASYSLYLVHPFMFAVVKRIGGEVVAQVNPVGGVVMFFVLSTVAGLLAHLYVEKPLTNFARRALRSRRAPVRLAT